MPSTPDARCVILVGRDLRGVFSVRERPNGDLLVTKSAPGYLRQAGSIDNEALITSQKYSVHRSLQSAEGINALKHTLILADGRRPIVTRHYTNALKAHNQYALLYSARALNLADRRHIASVASEQLVDLGRYDPAYFNFYYTVAVGRRDRAFDMPRLAQANVAELVLSHFRIIVIWSFSSGMTTGRGAVHHYLTLPSDSPGPFNNPMLGAGFDEQGCLSRHYLDRAELFVEHEVTMLGSSPERLYTKIVEEFAALGFFLDGRKNSPEYLKRLAEKWPEIVKIRSGP
jgi:hypothetical protein